VTRNKNNFSALSLKRRLGVAYSTAWRIKHKLPQAMRQREQRRQGRVDGARCLPASKKLGPH
jgi:hypothetical protein